MMNRFIVALGAGLIMSVGSAWAQGVSPRPSDAQLYIGWPNDGEIVRATRFRVWFGLRNMGIAPAGIEKANTGHHHLIVDTELPPFDEEIPNDPNHLHFGAGQSEVRLDFPPGEHTLQMLMGDAKHVPHTRPLMSERITIIVPQ